MGIFPHLKPNQFAWECVSFAQSTLAAKLLTQSGKSLIRADYPNY
ncbi:hypothetical protein GMES_3206 [Paraglaciecola mesophila KMM 241]|uniref:Uncharacterized protein n=1 Tax=Paraglaciecola mesophila KMM 241 TaxID=1128912 RepID=K6XY07_9ALTE|nr:hypothetical protein GMES_3206 [Paraglaciecola mesophila KMM 241]